MQAIHAQRAAGIIGDGEKAAVRGDVAGVLAMDEDRFLRFARNDRRIFIRNDTGRLVIQELKSTAFHTPGPDGGRGVRHLADGVHLVAIDSEIGRVGHFGLADSLDECTVSLVENQSVETVGIRADVYHERIPTGAGYKGKGHEEKQRSQHAPPGRNDSSE